MMAHYGILPHHEHHIRVFRIREGVPILIAKRLTIGPESACQFLGKGVIVILRTHGPEQSDRKRSLGRAGDSTAAHECERLRPVLIHDGLKLFSDFIDSLIPRDSFECVPDFFKRMKKSVGVVLMKAYVQSLAANIPLTA